MSTNHKRISKPLQSQNKLREKIVLITTVVYPLTTFGQVYEIFNNHSADNISLLTYSLYLFFTLVLLWYGVAENLKPIIILQSLWFVMYSAVLVGILLY